MLATAVVTYAAGVATTTAATSAFITDVSRRARYGTAHGVFGTIYDIGDAAGPIGAGFLVAAVGYAAMFRTLAVVGLTMAWCSPSRRDPMRARLVQLGELDRRPCPGIEGDAMRINYLSLLILATATVVGYAASRTFDFAGDAIGQPPKGFVFGHTAKVGAPGTWVVQSEGTNQYLAQTNADSTSSRFPVAVVGDISTADVDVSVRFRPVSGRVDQAAGLVWRYQNEDNYYLVRANALEDNVVLYKVERGRRTDLPVKGAGRTYGKAAEVPTGQWSTLRSSRPDPGSRYPSTAWALRSRGRHLHGRRSSGRLDQGRLRDPLR